MRQLYEILLERTNHVKVSNPLAETFPQVWLSWTAFEVGIDEVQRARGVFERANKALEGGQAEERILLLDNWKAFEEANGDEATMAAVVKFMPKKVKKRRQLTTADGADAGVEEYFDYIFPQDQCKWVPPKATLALFSPAHEPEAARGGHAVQAAGGPAERGGRRGRGRGAADGGRRAGLTRSAPSCRINGSPPGRSETGLCVSGY